MLAQCNMGPKYKISQSLIFTEWPGGIWDAIKAMLQMQHAAKIILCVFCSLKQTAEHEFGFQLLQGRSGHMVTKLRFYRVQFRRQPCSTSQEKMK